MSRCVCGHSGKAHASQSSCLLCQCGAFRHRDALERVRQAGRDAADRASLSPTYLIDATIDAMEADL